MSLVKDVARKFAEFTRTILQTEPTLDKHSISTTGDGDTSPILYDLTVDSPESKASALGSRSLETTVNQRVAEGFENIEHSRAVDQEDRTNDKSMLSPSARSQAALSTIRNRERNDSKRGRSSPEERRALGLPEKKPRDAVTVAIPTSSYDANGSVSLDMAPRTNYPPQPFKPRNTLDSKPTLKSSLASFFDDNVGGGLKEPRVPTKQYVKGDPRPAKQVKSNIRENNHRNPHKKQRLNSSPRPGTAEDCAIDLDDSHEGASPRQLSQITYTSYSGLSDDKWPIGTKVQDTPVSMSTGSRLVGANISKSAQISSLPVNIQSEDELHEEEGIKFMKGARNQRLQEGQRQSESYQLDPGNTRELKRMNSILESPPGKTTSGYFANAPGLINTSKRVRPPDESPDALQSDVHMAESTPLRRRVSLQEQSATSIANRINISDSTSKTKAHRVRSQGPDLCVPLRSVIFPGYVQAADYGVLLAKDTIEVEIRDPLLSKDPLLSLPLDKVTKIENNPDNTKLIIHFSAGVAADTRVLLDFFSLKPSIDFLQSLQGMRVLKIVHKSSEYMDKVFANGPSRVKEFSHHATTNSSQRQGRDAQLIPTSRDQLSSSSARGLRLVDRLDLPKSTPEKVRSPSTIVTGADRAGELITPTTRSRPPMTFSAKDTRASSDMEASRTTRTTRATRSKAGNTTSTTTSNLHPTPSRPDVCQGMTPWERPLIYPAHGKNCAMVVYDDLKRLNDDEFLNDNLVSLFLRYLQEHANPDAVKRMHFFNTFFHETLAKERKARGGIDYEAVAKWTRNINIFHRDFVVVPVNESLHWFVMIICNLSRLKRAHDPPNEAEDTDEVEEITLPNLACEEKAILTSDVLHSNSEAVTRESFQEMSLDENTAESIPVSHRKGRKAKQKRPLPKYDTEAPVIITLDSLDQPRSGTAKVLRDYIQALAADEGQAHRAFHVDAKAAIKGMTGKGIPHQNNFSDCGLYLCMYMEQFMTDPTKFTERILRREEADQGWPSHIESGALRDRLLQMIVELHKEQESKGSYHAKIDPVGSILVSMQPGITKRPHVELMEARTRYDRMKNLEERDRSEQPPIVIDQADLKENQTVAVSPYFEKSTADCPSQEVAPNDVIPIVQLDNPADLAMRLRQERSPERHDVQKESPIEVTRSRTVRQSSVSTDFLAGDQSFEMQFT